MPALHLAPEDFRVSEGASLDLAQRPTDVKPLYQSHKHYAQMIEAHIRALTEQQEFLYANNSHSLLLIFQAMDAAGKDSAIKHVMSGVNPQGCQVFSFKHPSAQELAHDFLWRTSRSLPERGNIGIFNRSYYEEVLIVRVQPSILRSECLPRETLEAKDFWQQRYQSIAQLEHHLHRNGTRVIKFFLHVSKEEQCKRLLDRIDDPQKNWKFNAQDIQQRKFWQQYQSAYSQCLQATSTKDSPWYVVPADDKQNTRLIIPEIVLKALQDLKMAIPKSTMARKRQLHAMRKQLV
jgi:PPK2 family polyphosphate:nucleotide phosphotransferase